MPFSLNVPTLGILAATLVEFGTHEQKARHLPAILRGEELWVQFLSEPSGGSDLVGCLTRADRVRRRVPVERLQNLGVRPLCERLRHVPRPHQLDVPEAPWPHHVPS